MRTLGSARSVVGVLAATLICALILFTTVYRNSGAFSPATATRCYSLSTDHTDAHSLFDADRGPLETVPGTLEPPGLLTAPEFAPADLLVSSIQPRALSITPLHRPPPVSQL